MKKIFIIALTFILCAGLCTGCTTDTEKTDGYISRFENENVILLSDDIVKVNGKKISENGNVYLSNNITYYENKTAYDSGNPYGEGTESDMHSDSEASQHSVINITKSGAYRVSGTLSKGQILIDLGEDAGDNPDAVVELILDNADITCTVAPAIVFKNVYESDTNEEPVKDVNTQNAGAVIVLKKDSINNINGSYVAKIFKDNAEEKKLCKQDGAIYSYMSMNVQGSGTLNLVAENEGLDTERHLTINGGNINITSQNDGINTNEDGVSVTTINGGNITIYGGLGDEGDGIDSNGWIVINGGSLASYSNPAADSGLDADMGIFINGGEVFATGSIMDKPRAESNQPVMNLDFVSQLKDNPEFKIKDEDGKTLWNFISGDSREIKGAIISLSALEFGKEYSLFINDEKQGYYDFGKDFKGGERPVPPEGEPKGEFPFDKNPPEMPKGELPQMPGEMPLGGDMKHGPHMENFEGKEQKEEFIITKENNSFMGVSTIKE